MINTTNLTATNRPSYNLTKTKTGTTKILWFSRHNMSITQFAALCSKHGRIEVRQIDRTISSARELSEDIEWCDVCAIVAPIALQAEFLRLAGEKPVIMAVSDRVLIPSSDGTEQKIQFQFRKWERLRKIEVVKEEY